MQEITHSAARLRTATARNYQLTLRLAELEEAAGGEPLAIMRTPRTACIFRPGRPEGSAFLVCLESGRVFPRGSRTVPAGTVRGLIRARRAHRGGV